MGSEQTFYIKNDGSKFTGIREIDGNIYYFKAREAASPVDTGVLQKGISILLEEGQNSPRTYGFGTPTNITRRYYFDSVTGQAVKNRYVQENDGWYYYGADGNAIRPQDGEVNIDGQSFTYMLMVVKLRESLFSTMVFFATMILILEHASLTPL